MNQENKQLPTASDYIETVYGTKNFARTIAVQDAPSLMGLMENFADHCSKPLRDELEKLRAENEKLKSDTDRRIKGYNDLHDDLIRYSDKYDQAVQYMEKLKAENQKLREALEDIASDRGDYLEIAKEALKGVTNE